MNSSSALVIMENLPPKEFASLSSVSPAVMPKRRTEWAEPAVEEFLSLPFISEFVFRSVRTEVSRKQEEVADFLILHRGACLLVEQKCQEDPSFRTPRKAELWARKKAKEGWSQLRRAFTRPRDLPVWCDHPRSERRVEFRGGLPPIQHGIVTVEVFEPVDLQPDAVRLPLDYDGVPITYLSVNDFLNLAVQLRSVPDVMDYLGARCALPPADLRLIGEEKTLFSFYLLNDGSFTGCAGLSDARIALASEQDRLRAALRRKLEADRYAHLLEHIAGELATRNPSFAEGVAPNLLGHTIRRIRGRTIGRCRPRSPTYGSGSGSS
jgi:hypothetical protein